MAERISPGPGVPPRGLRPVTAPPPGRPTPSAGQVQDRRGGSAPFIHPSLSKSAVPYRALPFLEKTGAIGHALQKLEAHPPETRSREDDRGIAIVREHLFLVLELERIAR